MNWMARSCFTAAARVLNVPRFRLFRLFGSGFREYSRNSPDFSFRIIAVPQAAARRRFCRVFAALREAARRGSRLSAPLTARERVADGRRPALRVADAALRFVVAFALAGGRG